MLTKAPKGTRDITPEVSYQWQYLEKVIGEVCADFGYSELRTPVFEHTELFERGVGDTTDVVQKEMYTFFDKGNRSITLRPEGTAGAVRSYIENHMYANPLPIKLYYQITCYRYEKPQAGRLREFHQFGAEAFGSDSPMQDSEMISLVWEFFRRIGLTDVALHLSSNGCPACRVEYNKKLTAFLEQKKDRLCPTCADRLSKNPLRIFDCKSESCQAAIEGAPLLFDHICGDCRDHFSALEQNLKNMNISYILDKKIVRGLDYYTKTVFEFVSSAAGPQKTLCGGGRYDGLVEELGGDSTPGIGFGMGMERILLHLENCGITIKKPERPSLFIATIGERAALFAQRLVFELRQKGLRAETDIMRRSLKAQMKYADKTGFTNTVCLGDDEIESGKCELKNMQTGEKREAMLSGLFEAVL